MFCFVAPNLCVSEGWVFLFDASWIVCLNVNLVKLSNAGSSATDPAWTKEKIKNALKASYSRELCDLLYSYPYIKIKILEENNIAKRQTASEYLNKLEKIGVFDTVKIDKDVHYINKGLMEILAG